MKIKLNLITQDHSILPNMWLSSTEGDKNRKLAKLDHWPKTELIKNETRKLEAIETVWRAFYTGQRLDNWKKPYYSSSEDNDTYNCMAAYTAQLVKSFNWVSRKWTKVCAFFLSK